MAAGGIPGNVRVGPGRIYVAAIGTAEPVSASAVLPSAWFAVGYTEEGSLFSTSTTSEPLDVAEELDPIRYENTSRESSITFSMAEVTRRNLFLALNQGAGGANDATIIQPPNLGAEVRTMIVVDSDETPSATNVRWIFRRGYQSGTIELARRKSPQKSLVAVTFRLELPTGQTAWAIYPNSSGLIA